MARLPGFVIPGQSQHQLPDRTSINPNTVDANMLSVEFLGKCPSTGLAEGRFAYTDLDFLVFGSVTINTQSDGSYGLEPDNYRFE